MEHNALSSLLGWIPLFPLLGFLVNGLLGKRLPMKLSGTLCVALQAVGAAAGNMVAIHNVVAASATVGLLDEEGTTMRKTIIPTLYYVAAAGWLGLMALPFWPDPFG